MTNSDSKPTQHSSSSSIHRHAQSSTTLNRKYVSRPGIVKEQKITSTAKSSAENLARRRALAEQINRERLANINKTKKQAQEPAKTPQNPIKKTVSTERPNMHPLQKRAITSIQTKKSSVKNPVPRSMKEEKDAAIKSALSSVSTMDRKNNLGRKLKTKNTFGVKKILIAFTCAAASVAAIVYFVNLNVPDVSIRVAAMQSGIDVKYPTYIPREYSLSSVATENNKIDMTFSSKSGATFSLTEEKSSWNSSALESNYIKSEYGSNYTTLREQGLTIFISGSNAAWVNGGILYKITATGESLTKKQIKTVATSL